MNSQLPILLFLVPFVTAVAMPILCARRRSWCPPLTMAAVSLMVVLAILNLRLVLLYNDFDSFTIAVVSYVF